MKFASVTQRISVSADDSWAVHVLAMKRIAEGDDIILLSIGEDITASAPAPIVDETVASLRSGRHHYTHWQGEPELRQAIVATHNRRTGQDLCADNCIVTSGAQNALFATLACLLEPGDEVVVPEPYYTTYPATLTATGARMVAVPTDPERNFRLEPERLAAAITPRTRVVVINSPNNPTGAVYDAATLGEVARLCRDHDLWLVCDEVYADFAYDVPHLCPCTLPGMAERCVTISSLSKSHRMSGWRLGWAIAERRMIDHLARISLCMQFGLPGFTQDGALEALTNPPGELRVMLEAYRRRRDLVCRRLEGLAGLEVRRPAGGMFVMVDIRPSGLNAMDFAMALLERHNVSVLPADTFGPSARGHVRMGLTADEDSLEEACDRIESFVGSYSS